MDGERRLDPVSQAEEGVGHGALPIEVLDFDLELGKDPAGTKVKHRPVDPAAQARLRAEVEKIPPHER